MNLWKALEDPAKFGAVIVFLFGVLRYANARWRESRKAFLEKQFDLYFQATRLVSELATMQRDDPAREKKLGEFWRLYRDSVRRGWGRLRPWPLQQ
jgi:hypothetical protein